MKRLMAVAFAAALSGCAVPGQVLNWDMAAAVWTAVAACKPKRLSTNRREVSALSSGKSVSTKMHAFGMVHAAFSAVAMALARNPLNISTALVGS